VTLDEIRALIEAHIRTPYERRHLLRTLRTKVAAHDPRGFVALGYEHVFPAYYPDWITVLEELLSRATVA
jgi:hypothetical protein